MRSTMVTKSVVLSITVLLSLICKGSSINCFYCNSANNSACHDLNLYDDETIGRIIPIINCESAIPNAEKLNFFCRKMSQIIYRHHQEPEVRVTRGCGWVPHTKECYRVSNGDHLEMVCQCFTDHCNGADMTTPAAVGWFLMLTIVLYYYR